MARRIGRIQSNGSSAFTGDGDVHVAVGTGTMGSAPTTPSATIPWACTTATSGAVNGNQAGSNGPNNYLWGRNPVFTALLALGANIAASRIWIGLSSTSFASLLATDLPGAAALSGACFRYSTAQNDSTWKAVTFDAVGQTIVDTGVPVVASKAYELEISDDGNATHFRINGQDVAEIRSRRPAAATTLRQGAGVQTLEAVAKALTISTLETIQS